MIFGIVFLIVLYLIYMLFVEGFLWRGILFFAGWMGLHAMLQTQPWAQAIVGVVGGVVFSWAAVIPTVICFMALLTTKEV